MLQNDHRTYVPSEDISCSVSKLFRFHLPMFYNHKNTEFHSNGWMSHNRQTVPVKGEVVPVLDIWGVGV
jgi:hypothetical protein